MVPIRAFQVSDRVMSMRVDNVALLGAVSPVVGSELTSKLDRAQDAVADADERAQTAIVAVASSTVDVIGKRGARVVRSDQVEVTFGLKVAAQGNVVVAGASGEATLEVKPCVVVTAWHVLDSLGAGEQGVAMRVDPLLVSFLRECRREPVFVVTPASTHLDVLRW